MTAKWRIEQGDVLERLRAMPAESVQCVVTSPPYWGLRDYGVKGQIGLEATPAAYLKRMVEVFREVRRVLRSDGTCWVNMGDGYCNTDKWGGGKTNTGKHTLSEAGDRASGDVRQKRESIAGLKPKDLIGMPWRLAFALQADGWWLRQDIIWSKPNPMPESVTDRCTKAHEYLFLLTKSARYFYDAEAIKEPANGCADDPRNRWDTKNYEVPGQKPQKRTQRAHPRGLVVYAERQREMGRKLVASDAVENRAAVGNRFGRGAGWRDDPTALVQTRNKRTVWEIATEAFPEAHFATFPTKLVEPCILAGTSERGACARCGAPTGRVVKQSVSFASGSGKSGNTPTGKHSGGAQETSGEYDIRMGPITSSETVGWQPTCKCGGGRTYPCVVLDPFSGAGTTGLVALRLGREYVGIELNPEYVAMSERRLATWWRRPAPKAKGEAAVYAPLFAEVTL